MVQKVNRKEDKVLYIIGNGFDIAHHLPTTYECFHKWLIANRELPFIRAFEKLYPGVKDDIGRWCDLESALGNVSLEHAVEIDLNYQDFPDEMVNEKSSHYAYRYGENLKRVTKVLPSCLHDWIHSIDLSNCEKMFEFHDDACFFSFNYTRTLEDVYEKEPKSIHHVHGTIGKNEELVVGYGKALFEEDEKYESDNPEINPEMIVNILRERCKPVKSIIKQQKFRLFMQQLSEISSVVVYGHSCSEVDKPYFIEIAKSIKADAHWTYYVHNSERNNYVKRYADSIQQKHQTVEITNESPIELLK